MEDCIYFNSSEETKTICDGADPYPEFRECECKNCYMHKDSKEEIK